MTDATLQLQVAIVKAIEDDAPLGAIIGDRIFDNVPAGTEKPYISIGPSQFVPETGECLDGGEVFFQLDAWSAGPDSVQVKRIGAALIKLLKNFSAALEDDQRIVDFEIEQSRYLTDRDGITQHAVVIVRARTEPTD